jgi:hypothetical protein
MNEKVESDRHTISPNSTILPWESDCQKQVSVVGPGESGNSTRSWLEQIRKTAMRKRPAGNIDEMGGKTVRPCFMEKSSTRGSPQGVLQKTLAEPSSVRPAWISLDSLERRRSISAPG